MEDLRRPAKRWARYPAAVLFALSLLWLLRSFFELSRDPAAFQDLTHTGIGIAQVIGDMLIIPVGCVVVGIYLLYQKRWAFWAAALLPLKPLLLVSARKAADVTANFHQYNETGQLTVLYEGLVDLLVLAGFWLAFALMLQHLWQGERLLRRAGRWRRGAAESGGAAAAADGTGAEEVCFLMPEVEEVEAVG